MTVRPTLLGGGPQTKGNMQPKPTPQNWMSGASFLFLLLGFLILNVFVAGQYLLTVLMGGIISILLYPLYQRLLRSHWSRGWAAFALTLATAIIIVAPIVWFASNAVKQAVALAGSITDNGNITMEGLAQQLSQNPVIARIGITPEEILQQVRDVAKIAAGVALTIIQTVPQILLHLIIALLTCLFLLRDGRQLINWLQDKIPLDPDARHKLVVSFKQTAISTILASFVSSAAEALLMFLAFGFLQVPASFLAGAFSFFLAWIPIVGTSPVWAIGAIYLYTHDHVASAIILVILGLSGGVMNNFIRAWVIRGHNNLHPMVSLVTIIGGIAMFGILGVFFGPILAAVLISLLDVWPAVGRRNGLLKAPERPETKVVNYRSGRA